MTEPVAMPDQILAQAAQWHVASHGDAMDWDAFTLWLEADPRHAAAYDAVARTDALLADHAAELADDQADHANDAADHGAASARRRALPRFAAAAIAAAAGIALVLGWPQPQALITRTGDTARVIALADGSQITLAPRSLLTVAGNRLALDGEAHFAIRHDPSRALQIAAGPVTIDDIGTTFDIATSAGDGGVRIAVTEGSVTATARFDATVHLGQGDGVQFQAGTPPRVVAGRSLGLTGWTSGALSYDNAPLALVAEDIARLTGTQITVAPDLATRRFSGSLSLTEDGAGKGAGQSRAARDLAKILNLRLILESGRTMLAPAAR